ncbi:hypothetical protein [Pseudonocardia lacus]|uniref:hypothetical protein n=1 Tax=Pseudonocardia lacus TaxID=2835865 RepID=UPI001BDD0E19|nr:hypothetical protein [Pseudonocardia lacus]
MGTSFEEQPKPPDTPYPSAPLIPAQRQAPPSPFPSEPAHPPRRWPWLLGGLAAGLLVGGGVGATAFPSTIVQAAPAVTVTAPAPPPETVTVTVVAPPVPAAAVEPSGPLTTFSSGVWEVGVDIAAGKYKTAGTDGYGCYYARLRENDGTLEDIISNGFVQGPATVTVRQSDGYFETSGCEDWVRVE